MRKCLCILSKHDSLWSSYRVWGSFRFECCFLWSLMCICWVMADYVPDVYLLCIFLLCAWCVFVVYGWWCSWRVLFVYCLSRCRICICCVLLLLCAWWCICCVLTDDVPDVYLLCIGWWCAWCMLIVALTDYLLAHMYLLSHLVRYTCWMVLWYGLGIGFDVYLLRSNFPTRCNVQFNATGEPCLTAAISQPHSINTMISAFVHEVGYVYLNRQQ